MNDQLKITEATLSNWLSGRKRPSLEKFVMQQFQDLFKLFEVGSVEVFGVRIVFLYKLADCG